ncbi:hypothetical protein MPSEU_000795000 [Mayamaea pseudoterrestris]|nr:hypothetical protein MPSEU_000795000 [Mayamaea pseudoterrestris]
MNCYFFSPSDAGDDHHEDLQHSSSDQFVPANHVQSPPSPLCSVLATVIDYIMMDPTPLEPKEFHEATKHSLQGDVDESVRVDAYVGIDRQPDVFGKATSTKHTNNLQVPVFRIFGPILRRDFSSYDDSNDDAPRPILQPPKQSACLYIHGAFPYMLARPVVAGPDGGPGRYALLLRGEQDHTDWDCPKQVEGILTILQDALEATLQASVSSASSSKKTVHARFIRQLTVVVGRGFYTYCPGIAAPFVRIEYYDPSQRWRIKLALEKGLADVPYQFHPNPKQYTYDDDGHSADRKHDDDDASEISDNPPETLAFHCYEAHIPYSMQFFKDYNLAGMSYIHLEQALFRRELPLRASIHRSYPTLGGNDVSRNYIEAENSDETQLFLRSNTESVWPPLPQTHNALLTTLQTTDASNYDEELVVDDMALENLPDLHQATPEDLEETSPSNSQLEKQNQRLFPSLPTQASSEDASVALRIDLLNANLPGGSWSRSQTSCQVELDTTVAHILNVHDVLTQKQDQDDNQHVCWRAVPSLEAMWTQERRRMRRLLPPQDDFLSQPNMEQPVTPPLTLQAPDGGGKSGARLAKEGMERLVRVTDGLYDAHRRVAKDIVEKHGARIDRIDADMAKVKSLHLREKDIAYVGAEPKVSCGLTPTDEEALLALEDLGGDGGDELKDDGDETASLSPWLDNPATVCSDDDQTDKVDALDANFHVSMSQMPLSQASSPCTDDEHMDKVAGFAANLHPSLSQMPPSRASSRASALPVSACGRFGHECDVVDWQTQMELTQRIDRGDGLLLDGPMEHVDEYIDPETLRPYEDLDDDETIYDDQCNDVNEMSSHLQSPLCPSGQIGISRLDDKHSTPDRWQAGHQNVETVIEQIDNNMIDSDAEDYTSHTSQPFHSPLSSPANPNEAFSSDNKPTDLNTVTAAFKSMEDDILKPPTRGEILEGRGTTLLPMEREKDQPSWMFASSYFQMYPHKIRSSLPKNSSEGGYSITRTCPPPNYKTVLSWVRRTRPPIEPTTPVSKKRQRVDIPFADCIDKVDERNVEEVEWRSSQPALASQLADESCSQSQSFKENLQEDESLSISLTKSTPDETMPGHTPSNDPALKGIGAQGGKLHIEGGGNLKATTRPSQSASRSSEINRKELPSPVSLLTVEIHVQCRKGKDASSRPLALTPQPDRDRVSAIVYALGIDPGGGESLEVVERGCLLVPPDAELEFVGSGINKDPLSTLKASIHASMPVATMGKCSPLSVECFLNERQLILRFASLVRWKDPDLMCSWDTQGAGLGFLIERSSMMKDSNNAPCGIDLAKLLGRTPTVSALAEANDRDNVFQIETGGVADGKTPLDEKKDKWKGSGMGADWDERVGAGVAASSIVGRLVFASWKLVAEEVKHPNASYLQAVVATVTGKRIPFHDNLKLTQWYSEKKGRERWRVLHYRLVQAMSTIVLFDAMDVIGRAGEAARLSGVELSQSFPGIRGSQYKVEGVLLRALQSLDSGERGTKAGMRPSSLDALSSLGSGSVSQTQSPWKERRGLNRQENEPDNKDISGQGLLGRRYFFYSPSLHAADRQEALQVQALTLEPKSGHYNDPVVVCDFTALYPSLVIAYNLCYSTIGGHLEYQSTRSEMRRKGRTSGKIGPFSYPEGRSATILKHHLKSLFSDRSDRAYIAPTGDIYVSETVVKGVLPQVLDEMLTTRAMLKRAAKLYKRNVKDLPSAVLRQLEARQLALKYVANVTYGYTSATFSGRCAMPLLADTIVECGRRTLTDAINLANRWGSELNGRWKGCTVIYGDTDSVFVRLPGRSVHEAFRFGEEFCTAVTKNNPPPVQLKLEKVYAGSIMQTKKKYCGMKYESIDQRKPEFEAKGIETIRRDQCNLTQKVLANALKTLFSHGVPAVKDYLVRQWRLIESGKLPVSDFILTGRVRSKYRASLPVQAALARRLTENDPGRVVRHKERLAYVIVASPGKAVRLSDAVLTPLELMEHWDLYTVNTSYYITKHVNAALQRCLGLNPHNVDVHEWYKSSPKPRRRIHFWPTTGRNAMISSFFGSDLCWFCGRKSKISGRSHVSICSECRSCESRVVEVATRRMNQIQAESQVLAQTCSRCNFCFESSETFAALEEARPGLKGKLKSGKIQTPIANCTCIDCPNTYRRHRSREDELELRAVFQALDID